jgi:hypothetical protein
MLMHVVVCGGGLFFTPVAVVLQVYCASLVGGQRCRHRPGWLISTLFKRLDVAGPASGVVFGLPPRKHIWLAGAEWRAEQASILRVTGRGSALSAPPGVVDIYSI